MLQIQTRSVIDELIIPVKLQTTGLCSYCYGLNPFFIEPVADPENLDGGGEGGKQIGGHFPTSRQHHKKGKTVHH